MGFKDVLKKSFLEGVNVTDFSITSVALTLAVTAALGIYIYLVYRLVSKREFYSKNFNISLVALAMITAAIILSIQSSVVISLGMVGALSIVRFRTAIKDPMDLVFLFWSIAVGIICGAGLYGMALMLSLCVTIVILVLDYMPSANAPMLLVLNAADAKAEDEVTAIVSKYAKYYRVKSRNLTKSGMDMVMELRIKTGEVEMVREINALSDVESVSLLSHDGEATI
ncbi:MAG: DUF4956 domain-containing protein [Lachnospiraceae bacterium]|nr:DUF4956 domain-containing protein [Lachnospiraceae bacterium]